MYGRHGEFLPWTSSWIRGLPGRIQASASAVAAGGSRHSTSLGRQEGLQKSALDEKREAQVLAQPRLLPQQALGDEAGSDADMAIAAMASEISITIRCPGPNVSVLHRVKRREEITREDVYRPEHQYGHDVCLPQQRG